MNARWAPHWQLLSAGWRMGSRWSAFRLLTVGFLLFGVACFAGSTSLVQKPALRQFSAGLSVLPLAFLWLLQSTTLLRFNHPVDARLVPQQLQCLRETFLGLWLAFVAVAGAAALLTAGLPVGNGALIMLLIATGALIPLVWVRWPLSLTPVVLVWLALQWKLAPDFIFEMARGATELLHSFINPHPFLTSLFVVVALLALARLLTHGIVRSGGDAHTTRFRLSLLVSGNPQTRSGLLSGGRWVNGSFQLNRYQRAALCGSQRTSGTVLQRVLGMRVEPVAGWRMLMPYAIVVLVVCSGQWFQSALTATLVLGFACVWSIAGRLGTRSAHLVQTAKEHALWMLLPGMPQGVALNRALATRFLKEGLFIWGGVAALSTLPSFLPPATYTWDGTSLSLLVIGLLPSVAFAANDWSRLPLASTTLHVPNGLLWCAVGPLLCFAAFFGMDAPMWLLALCSVFATALLLGWRWRQLAYYPAALPAGRLR